MLQESLVILACSTNSGCSETANLYYQQNIELQQMIKTVESKALTVLPPLVTQYGAPFMYVVTGGTASIRLYGPFSINGNLKSQQLQYAASF